MTPLIQALARRLGLTEGQVYSILISAAVAVALLWAGIPPVLRNN